MKLYLFNSLTNKIDCLIFNQSQTINIYLCGPTVYDHVHVGNLRSTIIFDVLHRFLLCLGYRVKYIHNLTDIDDKIIQKAQKEKKPEQQITQHYVRAYFQNLYNYNILKPTFTPKVTNYVLQIQEFINKLLQKGQAYQQEKDILFRVKDNPNYGKLSKQKADKLQDNTRQITQVNKENTQDFVLWKNTQQGINWNYLLGSGRPGWHTECVVFINEIFQGKTIDIHGGGQDLLFPHHENERIQYLAVNNKELSKIWLHIGHLHLNQKKMSKSLGNVTLAKHFHRKYGANALRYLFLNSHYNQVINFSEILIQQAIDHTEKIKNLLKRLKLYFYCQKINIDKNKINQSNPIYQKTIQSLSNNLNTVKIFHYLNEISYLLNKKLDEQKEVDKIQELAIILYFVLDILGFKFELISYNSKNLYLLNKWQVLLQSKQYSEADQVRKQLQEKNIV